MVSALNGFGLAIGCMDIIGALFFELMIIFMMRQSRARQANRTTASELEQSPQVTSESLNGALNSKSLSPWMLGIYLLLLNVWIAVSMLMLAGIILVGSRSDFIQMPCPLTESAFRSTSHSCCCSGLSGAQVG